MYYSTFYSIFFIYLIGVNFLNAGDTKICAGAGDCTGNSKCLQNLHKAFDGATANFCVEQCDKTKVDSQCGKGETCDPIKDIANADVFTCAKNVQCMTDAFCLLMNPDKPTCNLFTLKCIGPEITTTLSTTVSTTTKKKVVRTTTEIVDSIEGPYGCKAHAKYCTDPLWIEIMRIKCPKTCGVVGGISGGITTCKDVLSDCPQRQNLCQHTSYIDFMKRNCPSTCGYC